MASSPGRRLRVRLVHWHEAEARERARRLSADRFTVEAGPLGPPGVRALAEDPPDAIAIELSRLPMQGRDLGLLLRVRKGTRAVPLVFLDGARDKVATVRRALPDAAYATWDEAGDAIESAVRGPRRVPAVPGSAFDAYAGVPLGKKLGIGPGTKVALSGAPPAWARALGDLPEGASVHAGARGDAADVAVVFVRHRAELRRAFTGAAAGARFLWVAWPKGGSAAAGGLTQVVVRRLGLDLGFVDSKIASLDQTWSALRVTRRSPRRGGR